MALRRGGDERLAHRRTVGPALLGHDVDDRNRGVDAQVRLHVARDLRRRELVDPQTGGAHRRDAPPLVLVVARVDPLERAVEMEPVPADLVRERADLRQDAAPHPREPVRRRRRAGHAAVDERHVGAGLREPIPHGRADHTGADDDDIRAAHVGHAAPNSRSASRS